MNLLIVSCDAGGAEIISSWVRNNPANEYTYLLEGPAILIFSKKISIIKKTVLKDIEATIHNFDIVMPRFQLQVLKPHRKKTVQLGVPP